MSSIPLPLASDSTSLAIPKLRDDGSNWSDYKPCLCRAMGAKGLWLHVEGKATVPKPYVELNRIPILSDGKTCATEEQIETKETHIVEFEKRECLAQHVLLSMTSVRIGSMIKNLMTAKEMWEQIKKDATTKSTLFLINAEDQLSSIHLTESDNPQTHLNNLKQHFELMMKRHDNLMEMGSSLSTT